MQIRTILYQYIKTLIKQVFLLNFTYELLMSFRNMYIVVIIVFVVDKRVLNSNISRAI